MDKDFLKGAGFALAGLVGFKVLGGKGFKKLSNPIRVRDLGKKTMERYKNLEAAGEYLYASVQTGEPKIVKKAVRRVKDQMYKIFPEMQKSSFHYKKELNIFTNFLNEKDEDKLLDQIEDETLLDNYSKFIDKVDKELGLV